MQLTSPSHSLRAAGCAHARRVPCYPSPISASHALRQPHSLRRPPGGRHVAIKAFFGEEKRVEKRKGSPGLLKGAGIALAGILGVSVLGSSLLAVGVAVTAISFGFSIAIAALAIVAPVGFFIWGIVKGLLLLSLLLAGGVGFLGLRTYKRLSVGRQRAVAEGAAPVVEERSWEQQERAVSKEMDELARLQQQELADFDRRLNGDSLSDFDRRLRGREKGRGKEPFEL